MLDGHGFYFQYDVSDKNIVFSHMGVLKTLFSHWYADWELNNIQILAAVFPSSTIMGRVNVRVQASEITSNIGDLHLNMETSTPDQTCMSEQCNLPPP